MKRAREVRHHQRTRWVIASYDVAKVAALADEVERLRGLAESLYAMYSGDGLDEAAIIIQRAIRPGVRNPKPDHAVQVGVRMLIDRIREAAEAAGEGE